MLHGDGMVVSVYKILCLATKTTILTLHRWCLGLSRDPTRFESLREDVVEIALNAQLYEVVLKYCGENGIPASLKTLSACLLAFELLDHGDWTVKALDIVRKVKRTRPKLGRRPEVEAHRARISEIRKACEAEFVWRTSNQFKNIQVYTRSPPQPLHTLDLIKARHDIKRGEVIVVDKAQPFAYQPLVNAQHSMDVTETSHSQAFIRECIQDSKTR